MPTVSPGKLYDFPAYYDLIFGADWREEFNFLRAAFDRYAAREVRRVFEPACGTGRLLVRLAKAGFQVSGLDLNAAAVEYCQRRFERLRLPAHVFVADMAAFKLKQPVDAAFNLINSFRHLPDEQAAAAHLKCMAKCLAPGGIYLLGLHLTPAGKQVCTKETWSAKRGRVSARSTMWSAGVDRRRRQERVGMKVRVTAGERCLAFEDEMIFRTYTAAQMRSLLDSEKRLELIATHDFAYNLNEPLEIDGRTEDVIFVLRKRG
ncbi:MAG: class I SAM-dependent methyltransferase [Planctomycetia bacterium]|nr:class I SAM-dependent methyltransferase [Planctomycetia bacterium]